MKLAIDLNDHDLALLTEVMERNPLARRHMIARAAIRAGLSQFARDQLFAVDCLTLEVRHCGGAK